MKERIYPCCDNPECPCCHGSGIYAPVIKIGFVVASLHNVGSRNRCVPAMSLGIVRDISLDGSLNIEFPFNDGSYWLTVPEDKIDSCLLLIGEQS